MSLEMCFNCDCETGNAGADEDSLILEGLAYCDDCYREEILNIIALKDYNQDRLEEKEAECKRLRIFSDIICSNLGKTFDQLKEARFEYREQPYEYSLLTTLMTTKQNAD